MDVDAAASDDVGITDKIKEKMSKLASELSKSRKKRDAPATLASEDTVASYKEKSTHPVHLANAILCLDLHPTNANLAVSGGADNNVVIFDRKSGQAAQKMKGHGKKVGGCFAWCIWVDVYASVSMYGYLYTDFSMSYFLCLVCFHVYMYVCVLSDILFLCVHAWSLGICMRESAPEGR